MGNFLRGLGVVVAAALVTVSTAWAQTQPVDPPGRVGRIAFVNGTVSFHDRDETNWAPAALNYPLTSGNALWTEPNGRAEVYVGNTRIRMQGSTQLEALSLTDDQFQLRISQGRIDMKTVGLQQGQQVEVLTPRGTAMLMGDGDYMIEAGTTDDATRVGVRAGSARVIASNGTELVVRPGEIGVLRGANPPVFETVRMAIPPMPPEWAPRDRPIVASQSAQYVPASMTGIEDLDNYGTWSTVGDYGRVWSPRTVPAGWAPYRQGRWRWVDPWGWTWVDDQPWAFAPSHYGRWVNNGGRWYWVPPRRDSPPIYAPAVVGFVDIAAGAATLAISASMGAPVGWFPLGPREIYMPSYTADRAYIRRLNAAYVANAADVDRRIEYAQRYRNDPRRDDPRRDGRPGFDNDRDRPTFINQRFSTVVPQQAFVRGERTDRAAIRVDADRLARVQAAPVAAPLVVSATVTPPAAPGAAPVRPGADPKAPAPAPAQVQPRTDVQRAPLADVQVLGRPSIQDRPTATAPGPVISRTQQPAPAATAPGTTAAPTERQLPNLRTRDGREVDRPATGQATPPAPAAKPGEQPKAAEPPKPPQAPAVPPVAAPPAKPDEQPKAAEPPKPLQAPAPPPIAAPPAKPGEQPKAAEPPKPLQAPAPPPVAAPPAKPADQPKAAEPPKPLQAPATPPVAAPPPKPADQPKAAEPPKAPQPPAAPKAAEPPRPAPPPVQQAKPPEPPRPAPQPQVAPPAPPAPPPQQAKPPAPPAAPPPQPKPPEQAKQPAPPAPPAQVKPPEQAKQPPGRDRDDKGGDDRRR